MTWQTLILNINAVACILITIRLMFFRKPGTYVRQASHYCTAGRRTRQNGNATGKSESDSQSGLWR